MTVLPFICYITWCFVYATNTMNLNIECEWPSDNHLAYLKTIMIKIISVKMKETMLLHFPQFKSMPLPIPNNLKLFFTFYVYSFSLLLNLGI